jgi:hypothetical protein
MTSLSVPVKPTRVLLGLFIVFHLLAVLSLVLLTISLWMKAIAILLVLSHGVWQVYRYWVQFPITQLGFNPSGFYCQAQQQEWVKVLPSSVITRLFISLHVQVDQSKKRFYLILPVWHYAPMEYRALARQMRLSRYAK